MRRQAARGDPGREAGDEPAPSSSMDAALPRARTALRGAIQCHGAREPSLRLHLSLPPLDGEGAITGEAGEWADGKVCDVGS